MQFVNHSMIFILGFFLLLNNDIHINPADELMAVDSRFSDYSLKHGRNKAFLQYCHEDGVMLVDNSFPVKGKASIAKMLGQQPDSSYILTWEPLFALCAASGELGYTYGIWTMGPREIKQGQPKDQHVKYGNYVTIWKKNSQDEWKFILDSGNEGLTE